MSPSELSKDGFKRMDSLRGLKSSEDGSRERKKERMKKGEEERGRETELPVSVEVLKIEGFSSKFSIISYFLLWDMTGRGRDTFLSKFRLRGE